MIPKKLAVGDEVIVKFEKGTIGYRHQGPGWHSATVKELFSSLNNSYMLIDLSNPTNAAGLVFGNHGTAIYPSQSKAPIDKDFRSTVIRKVSN